jgi:hypothetical protein
MHLDELCEFVNAAIAREVNFAAGLRVILKLVLVCGGEGALMGSRSRSRSREVFGVEIPGAVEGGLLQDRFGVRAAAALKGEDWDGVADVRR